MIQLRINQELKRDSDQFLNSRRNEVAESLRSRPARSKEDIYCLYNIEEKPLGEGGFGIVLKGELKKDSQKGRNFAIKVIDKKKANHKDMTLFLKEIELLKIFDHPNIVDFQEVYEDQEKFYIVLEFLEGGELLDRLSESKDGFDEATVKRFFWQMAYAVNYMHSRKIAHRDLKPENFMFKQKNGHDLKLIDFGLSQFFGKKTKMKTVCGSPYYLAPEILNQKYTSKCDVWSLGIMLFELLTGLLPFYSENNNDLFKLIHKGEYEKSILTQNPKKFSKECIDLVSRMIVVGEKNRIQMADVLKHEWFHQDISRMQMQGRKLITKKMLQNLLNFSVSSLLQREMMGLIVQAFHGAEEIEILKKIFMAFDSDFSGTIQKDEIALLFEELNMTQSEEKIEDIVDVLYLKEKGLITFLEFEAGLLDPEFFHAQQRLKNFFNYLDIDGNGYIEVEEIMDCFKRFGRSFEKKIVKMMIREVDDNSDGRIDFKEFEELMGLQS